MVGLSKKTRGVPAATIPWQSPAGGLSQSHCATCRRRGGDRSWLARARSSRGRLPGLRQKAKFALFASPQRRLTTASPPPRTTDRSCAGFWTPASLAAPLAPSAGVQKAPWHEVAGGLGGGRQPALWGFDCRAGYDGGREAGARRPGQGAERGLEAHNGDRAVVARSVSTGNRLVDWRGCGERDRRQPWSQRNGTGKRRR
jgi:hypothetical protein